MIYIILLILVTLATFLSLILHKNYNSINKVIGIFFLCVFIVLGGIKWRTGLDWVAYLSHYNVFNSKDSLLEALKSPMESGWVILNYITGSTLGSFTSLLFLWTGACVILQYKTLRRHSDYYLVIVFLMLGLHFGNITPIRQTLAVSIIFWSSKYLSAGNFKKYALGIIIATSFHISSFIFLPLYPIFRKNWSIHFKVLMLVSSLAIGISGIMTPILEQFVKIIGLIDVGQGGKLDFYVSDVGKNSFNSTNSKLRKLVLGFTKRSVVLPIIFYFESKLFKDDKDYKVFSNIFVIGNCIYFIIFDFPSLQRFATGMYMFEMGLLIMIFTRLKRKGLFGAFIIAYGIFKFAYYLYNFKSAFIPYLTIFHTDFSESNWW